MGKCGLKGPGRPVANGVRGDDRRRGGPAHTVAVAFLCALLGAFALAFVCASATIVRSDECPGCAG